MIFKTTLGQMAILFFLIVIGYILAKLNLISNEAEKTLSKLENYIFIPALVLGNFMANFTIDRLSGAVPLLMGSLIIEIIVIPAAFLLVKLCSKDQYIRNIYLYGLSFSNFGFMGNAIVSVLFPEIFLEYILFTLVLWVAIYLWGVPSLLMGDSAKLKPSDKLKNIINPMFIGMAVGMVIGLLKIPVPAFAKNLVDSLAACMSPIAMLLTGMTIARSRLLDILKFKSIYAVTFIRLIVFPLIFLLAALFIPMSKTFIICALSSLAMPLGLNTIVIPSAYGKDTKIASGMALVSHFLSIITIPVMYALMQNII